MTNDMKKMIDLAKKTLEMGNLVIFPTETVYGLGGDATNIEAIKKIYDSKNRPLNNPIICHFSNLKSVKDNCVIKELDYKLIKKFWPGPLTLILEKKKSSLIHPLISNNLKYIGCRIPNNKIALDLLKVLNFPLAAPSANISSKISSTHYDHISNKLKKNILILKGGMSNLGLESTVLKTYKKRIKILRLGSITSEIIKKKFPNNDIVVENYNS